MTINIIDPHQEGGFLCSTCLELFLARSSLFQLAMVCSASFHFLQVTAPQDFSTCNFTMNQLYVDFITKNCKRHYKVGQVGQVLQIGTGITKRDNFYLKVRQSLQSKMQYRRQMRETGEDNRFWQLIPLFTQHFTPKNTDVSA